MARRRFFVPEVRRGVAELTGSDAEHLVRVLRVGPGDIFELSDNQRVYLAVVESARKSAVVFRVSEEIAVAEPVVQIALCPALIKFDRFELLLEKATELGVAAIHPFSAARSEQGLLKAVPKRIERWRRIALEASQQSRRGRLPEIHDAVDSIQYLRVTAETRLFLDEDELVVPLLKRLAGQTLGSVALLTGPEGGWTEPERSAALEAGCLACGLGATTLRAETAAIAALAIVQAAAFAAS